MRLNIYIMFRSKGKYNEGRREEKIELRDREFPV